MRSKQILILSQNIEKRFVVNSLCSGIIEHQSELGIDAG